MAIAKTIYTTHIYKYIYIYTLRDVRCAYDDGLYDLAVFAVNEYKM